MNSRSLRRPLWGAVPVALALAAAACTDGPVSPNHMPPPEQLLALECRVDVHNHTMSCSTPAPQTGTALADVFGGQEKRVKLTNVGNSYDSGTGIYSMYVNVQNLLATQMGTEDGSTPTGIKVFFYQDPAGAGGTVTVFNEDGSEPLLTGMSDYFEYPEILDPYEISANKLWQFEMPVETSFTFSVLISADRPGASNVPYTDQVWDGSASTSWTDPANWQNNMAPGASSVVAIPIASLLGGANQPALSGSVTVQHLRVGTGSTLSLGGYDIAISGNVDAPGTISGGSVTVSGGSGTSLLRGTLPTLFVTGGAAVQGATRTTGAVSVTGSLTVADSALSISIP